MSQTAAVVARVAFPHAGSQAPSTFQVAVTDGALWVIDARGEYLVRIDLQSNRVTSSVPTDAAILGAGNGRLWSFGPAAGAGGPPPSTFSLGRVDLVSGSVEVVTQVPRGAVAVGLGAVWILRPGPMLSVNGDISATLVEIDPDSGKSLATWVVAGQDLFIGCDMLWTFGYSESGAFMEKVDPATGYSQPLATLPLNQEHAPALAGTSSCWFVTDNGLQALVGGELAAPVAVPDGYQAVVVGNSIWLRTTYGLLGRFDPLTRAIGDRWKLPSDDVFGAKGGPDWLLVSAGSSLWLINGSEAVRYDIPA